MRTRTLIPAATLLFGCSLRHHPVAPEPARGPAHDSLFHLDLTRGDSVAARGHVDGLLALLSPDVVYLRAGVQATFGRDAARALFAAAAGAANETMTWQPLGGGVSYDLTAAYTFGIAAHAPRSNPVIRVDHYIAFWQRERGQPWRIAAYAEVSAGESRGRTPSALEVKIAPSQFTPPLNRVSKRTADVIASVRAADSLFSDLADRMGVSYAFSNTVAPAVRCSADRGWWSAPRRSGSTTARRARARRSRGGRSTRPSPARTISASRSAWTSPPDAGSPAPPSSGSASISRCGSARRTALGSC